MIKICIVDGTPFEATKATAKYCSARCNKRAQRGQFGLTPPVQVPSRSKKAGSAPNSSVPGDSPLVVVVRRELEAAGVADTIDGQLALQLAVQMSGSETAGGMSSLSKEFSRVKAEALRGAVSAVTDPVDELQARREAKMAAG